MFDEVFGNDYQRVRALMATVFHVAAAINPEDEPCEIVAVRRADDLLNELGISNPDLVPPAAA